MHETYLRLCGSEPIDWQNRAHFFAVAAQQLPGACEQGSFPPPALPGIQMDRIKETAPTEAVGSTIESGEEVKTEIPDEFQT